MKSLVFIKMLKGSACGCRCSMWSRLRYIGIAWGWIERWTRLTSDAPLLWNGHRWMLWGWRSDVFCLIRALQKYSGHFDVFFTQLGYSIRPGAKTDSTYLGFSLTVFFFAGWQGYVCVHKHRKTNSIEQLLDFITELANRAQKARISRISFPPFPPFRFISLGREKSSFGNCISAS